MEDIGVEERGQSCEIAAEDREQLFAIPRQHPHHEDRVAEIRGNVASDAADQRPRGDDREHQIGGQRVPRTLHQSADASTSSSWSST